MGSDAHKDRPPNPISWLAIFHFFVIAACGMLIAANIWVGPTVKETSGQPSNATAPTTPTALVDETSDNGHMHMHGEETNQYHVHYRILNIVAGLCIAVEHVVFALNTKSPDGYVVLRAGQPNFITTFGAGLALHILSMEMAGVDDTDLVRIAQLVFVGHAIAQLVLLRSFQQLQDISLPNSTRKPISHRPTTVWCIFHLRHGKWTPPFADIQPIIRTICNVLLSFFLAWWIFVWKHYLHGLWTMERPLVGVIIPPVVFLYSVLKFVWTPLFQWCKPTHRPIVAILTEGMVDIGCLFFVSICVILDSTIHTWYHDVSIEFPSPTQN